METMEKKLQPAEVKRHTFCIPKEKQSLFPGVGQKIAIVDEKTGFNYDVVVGSQYRLCLHEWFRDHPGIRAGDTVNLRKENGNFKVDLTTARVNNISLAVDAPKASVESLRKNFFDFMMTILSGIEKKDLPGRIKLSNRQILIEWGEGISESEIIFGADRCTI